jgi:hypothetical protein
MGRHDAYIHYGSTFATARGWSNMFVRGLTPEQATDEVSREAYKRQPVI